MSFRRYRDFKPGEFVLVFCDTAWGGLDYCAGQFLSKDKLDIPLVYHENNLASDMTPLIHEECEKIYDITGVAPVLAYETNNGGTAELERLNRLNRNGKYTLYQQKMNVGTTDSVTQSKRFGYTTNSVTRKEMLKGVKEAIDNKLVRVYDKPTITELFSFVVKQGNSGGWKAEAESGAHDDLVMSLAGVWQLYLSEDRPYIDTNTGQRTGELAGLIY